MTDFGVTIMAHSQAEHVSVKVVDRTLWLEFGGGGYTRVQVNLGEDGAAADAVIAALQQYVGAFA